MERDKVWVLMKDEDPIAVCFTESDIQELYMDLVMQVRYENFCYYWLEHGMSMESCMKYNISLGGYWFVEVDSFDKPNLKTCATCGKGTNPLNVGGVRGKCYCSWCRSYMPANFYCKNWEDRTSW